MENREKQLIKQALEEFIRVKGSQNKAANALKGISPATVSQILNGNWELISDEMWRGLAAQLNLRNKTWNIVRTTNFNDLTEIFTDAQDNSLVMAVTGDAGCGKTVTAKHYQENNANVFVLCCNEFWNRKLFMQELLREMGKNPAGDTVGEMMADIVSTLKRLDSPIIIMDEADKLSDQVFYFFITLYNQLEDHCGIILMATDYLEKKVSRGLRLNKKGYKEIFSRIGRRFIHLQPTSQQDIIEVCVANGLNDRTDIKNVVDNSDSDLRRVRRKVFAINKKNAK
jgi:DNA transposition AAA+ family ATPase